MKGQLIDMRDVEDKPTFEICPKGEHIFEVVQKVDSTTKNGDPMVSLTLEVYSGPHKGKKVWDNIILSTNSNSPAFGIRWRAKMFLKAIGENHEGDTFEWDSERWVFQRCIGQVVHEIQKEGKYKDQPKAVIKLYLPLSALPELIEGSTALEDKDPQIPF